jgi:hypothetical protein
MRGVLLPTTFVTAIKRTLFMKPQRQLTWYVILAVSLVAVLIAVLGLLLG